MSSSTLKTEKKSSKQIERERERENLIYDFLYLVPEAKLFHR
jgi:hypothetical protein